MAMVIGVVASPGIVPQFNQKGVLVNKDGKIFSRFFFENTEIRVRIPFNGVNSYWDVYARTEEFIEDETVWKWSYGVSAIEGTEGLAGRFVEGDPLDFKENPYRDARELITGVSEFPVE